MSLSQLNEISIGHSIRAASIHFVVGKYEKHIEIVCSHIRRIYLFYFVLPIWGFLVLANRVATDKARAFEPLNLLIQILLNNTWNCATIDLRKYNFFHDLKFNGGISKKKLYSISLHWCLCRRLYFEIVICILEHTLVNWIRDFDFEYLCQIIRRIYQYNVPLCIPMDSQRN